MKHIVQFSGGAGSYCSAKRVVERHGPDDVVLLFADTRIEDSSLYEFIHAAAEKLGAHLEIIQDGRNPFEVMEKARYIGNTRIDPCSHHLKRKLLDRWRDANCTPESAVIYIGIDWTEIHRLERLQKYVKPDGWDYQAPMCDAPYLSKKQMIEILEEDGLPVSPLYRLGFAHNNCGGFCIKSGQAQFKKLLEHFPERYARAEAWEERMRNVVLARYGLGWKKIADHAMLRDRRGGGQRPLSLKEFRERMQVQPNLFDSEDWGGCGCALE
jgi:3'-phosphoadenosine 5'-phosphosulfate sulfotransferase (PAPS reductase)/FAD synthetase